MRSLSEIERNTFSSQLFHLIGYQQRLVECVRKDDRSYVNEKMCIKTQSKPMTKRPCNLKPCAAE